MALVKISTTLFIQWKFWESVKDLVLSPFSNAAVELTLFMLVIPVIDFLYKLNPRVPWKQII